MRKKITALAITIVLVMIFFNLVRQIRDALGASDRLDQAVDKLSSLQEENRRLQDRLETANQYDYIEQIARDKLNMAKNNESIVIISQKDLDAVLGEGKKPEKSVLTNWQAWLKLIVH